MGKGVAPSGRFPKTPNSLGSGDGGFGHFWRLWGEQVGLFDVMGDSWNSALRLFPCY